MGIKSTTCTMCRSTAQHSAAVEQYDLAASQGSRSKSPAYKELDIMVCPPMLQSVIFSSLSSLKTAGLDVPLGNLRVLLTA